MIIKAPTGLFSRVLPTTEEDGTPITWTISNNNPPPPLNRSIPKQPLSTITTPMPIPENRILDDSDRRSLFGPRVQSVVVGSKIHIKDGKKLFAAGDFIDFEEDTESVDQDTVPEEVVILHNSNVLDLSGSGLTDDEIEAIRADAERARDSISLQITMAQTAIEIMKSDISSKQKQANEATKILSSLAVLYGLDGSYPSNNEMFDKIWVNRDILQNDINALVESLNSTNAEVAVWRDKLVQLSEVVK